MYLNCIPWVLTHIIKAYKAGGGINIAHDSVQYLLRVITES